MCTAPCCCFLFSPSVLPVNFQAEEYEPPCAAQCILGELCKRHSGGWRERECRWVGGGRGSVGGWVEGEGV